eukprot:scpid112579/ scgid2812/ 
MYLDYKYISSTVSIHNKQAHVYWLCVTISSGASQNQYASSANIALVKLFSSTQQNQTYNAITPSSSNLYWYRALHVAGLSCSLHSSLCLAIRLSAANPARAMAT